MILLVKKYLSRLTIDRWRFFFYFLNKLLLYCVLYRQSPSSIYHTHTRRFKTKNKRVFLWVVGEMQSHHIGILLRLIACVLNATGVNFQKIGQQSSNGRCMIVGGLALSGVRIDDVFTFARDTRKHDITKTDFGYFRYFEFRICTSITFGTVRSDYIGM